MIRRILTILAVFVGIAGCIAKADDPAVVRLGYFANVTHAQAVLGVASGDFAQAIAPAELKTSVFNAGPSLNEAIFANELDIGYVGPGPALTAWSISHGQAIVVVSGAAANGVVIVAGPHSNIHSLADLNGKKIATPQRDNTQDISARHYVLDVLHEDDDSNVIPIANSEQVGRMIAGDIDASWAPEPWGSRLVAQAGGTIIGEEKDLWPGHEFSLTLVVVRKDFYQQHPDVVRKFLAVHQAWTKKLSTNPIACAVQLNDALSQLTKNKLPPDVLLSALSHVTFTDDPLPATLQTMAQWSLELGIARQPIKLDGLIDTSMLSK
jgi:NitT/TauT family transport system substrate-binding protein